MNRRSLFHDATPDPETQSDVRKDLAVHASLSSNQIVKEPALPSRDRKAAQPIDFTLSAATGAPGYAGRPHCLSGTTKPQRRASSDPAAGGRGDIFTVIPPVNSRVASPSHFSSALPRWPH
jgi:hypothetical protein